MTLHYSEAYESLYLPNNAQPREPLTTARVLIVGSGYGGAVAAYRLSEKKPGNGQEQRDNNVLVLERGKEYALGEFPTSIQDVGAFVNLQAKDHQDDLTDDALFNFRAGDGVDVLVGHGLGGTSLINANVAFQPPAESFAQPAWPRAIQSEAKTPGSALWTAFDAVTKYLGVENADTDLAKFRAFKHYANSLGIAARPAPIAVTQGPKEKENCLGVRQAPCTRCGNCVSGCNVGAKNTLAMNLIPAACSRGARFLTGAVVLTIRPLDGSNGTLRWRVEVRAASRDSRARLPPGNAFIDADYVILAAGALGSTEILQRSEELYRSARATRVSSHTPKALFSAQLGQNFSTNGDSLFASFAEREPVDALGSVVYKSPGGGANADTNPLTTGPTITAIAEGVTHEGVRFTLEDGAFPSPIVPISGEILTTVAQIQRIGDERRPAWFQGFNDGANKDILAVHREAMRRSQLFLVMGNDGAVGSLKFKRPVDGIDGRTIPTWPEDAKQDLWRTKLDAITSALHSQDRTQGLRGGQFVVNPLYQPLPRATETSISGVAGRRLVSVHPLGGCTMADGVQAGVVDGCGAVFNADTKQPWPGLYVLDGAIIPTALGVNPFLTISALAWRACDTIQEQIGNTGENDPAPIVQPLPNRRDPPDVDTNDYPIVVRERLVGKLDALSDKQHRQLRKWLPQFYGQQGSESIQVSRWLERDGLILQIATNPADFQALLLGDGKLRLTACLHQNLATVDRLRYNRENTVASSHLTDAMLVASGQGTVSFMRANPPTNFLTRAERMFQAARAYLQRSRAVSSLVSPKAYMPRKGLAASARWVGAIYNLLLMHCTYRDFEYEMTLEVPGDEIQDKVWLVLKGCKRIAWRADHDRLWKSLLTLPATLRIYHAQSAIPIKAQAELRVDTTYMLDEGVVSIASTPNGHSLIGGFNVLAFLARFARGVLQSSLFEFRWPDYPERVTRLRPDTEPLAGLKGPSGNLVKRQDYLWWVSDRYGNKSKQQVRIGLSAYCHEKPAFDTPVLLVHGLAQGSQVWAHRLQPKSTAAYFFEKGHDVWMVDYRLSNRFTRDEVYYGRWTVDDIAEFDMPAAVNRVIEHYVKQGKSAPKLHVFAHCVGSIGMAIAILTGKVTNDKLASVALNAIHPWTMPSSANRARALLLKMFKDLIGDEFFDPLPVTRPEVKPWHYLVDALAHSLGRLAEPKPEHGRRENANYSQTVCDRMTLRYGRMWHHGVTDGVHERLLDLAGQSPASVHRHLYYMLTNNRVCNHFGKNVYLLEDGLARWSGIRTLIVHGESSQVFNPQSAVRTAARLDANLNRTQITPPTPIRLKIVDGYGHIDPVLADSASEHVFPIVEGFFLGAYDVLGGDSGVLTDYSFDSHCGPDPNLAAGLIIRAARIEGDLLVLRVWGQKPGRNTAPVRGIRYAPPISNAVELVPPYEHPNIVREPVFWADLWIDPATFGPLQAEALFPPGGTGTLNLGVSATHPTGSTTINGSQCHWLNRLLARQQNGGPADFQFVVGSCRYTESLIDRSMPDEIFEGMHKLVRGDIDVACDLVFLIGDQIYADATGGVLDPKVWRDRYLARYQQAFSAKHMSEVLRSIPVHFAIDDHEIANNFNGFVANRILPWSPNSWQFDSLEFATRTGQIDEEEFKYARQAAYSYMGSRRDDAVGTNFQGNNVPIPGVPFGQNVIDPGEFWYALDHNSECPCPAFILDTRTERVISSIGPAGAFVPARLMTDRQLNALCEWLTKVKGPQPKFIFSGSVIVPLSRDALSPGGLIRSDGVAAYPRQLETIVSHIVENDIERVVFVGGDLHISAAAKLTLRRCHDGKSITAIQIVSSGLYIPIPAINTPPDSIDWEMAGRPPSVINLGAHCIEYSPELLCQQSGHFVHVCAEPAAPNIAGAWRLEAQAFDSKAMPVGNRAEYLL